MVKNPPANGGKLGRNGLHIVPGLHTDFQQVIKLIHRGQDSLSSGPRVPGSALGKGLLGTD